MSEVERVCHVMLPQPDRRVEKQNIDDIFIVRNGPKFRTRTFLICRAVFVLATGTLPGRTYR